MALAAHDAAMDTYTRTFGYRQFMWGLSNGITVLAVAGAFWCSMATPRVGWPVLAPVIVVGAVLVSAAVRTRRLAAGFGRRELRTAAEPYRARARRIQAGLLGASLLEGGMVGMAVWLCRLAQRDDLIWPAMALAVSLHFLPLAWLFSVRPYYATAAAGSTLALVLLLVPETWLPPLTRLAIVGAGMGAIMWITAAYVALRADRLVRVWDDAGGRA